MPCVSMDGQRLVDVTNVLHPSYISARTCHSDDDHLRTNIMRLRAQHSRRQHCSRATATSCILCFSSSAFSLYSAAHSTLDPPTRPILDFRSSRGPRIQLPHPLHITRHGALTTTDFASLAPCRNLASSSASMGLVRVQGYGDSRHPL